MLLKITPKDIKGKSMDCNVGCDCIMLGRGSVEAKCFLLKSSYLQHLHRRGQLNLKVATWKQTIRFPTGPEATADTEWNALLTRGLHFIDVLQEVLPLVDDIKGQVVHGQSFVCVVLEALFRYCEVFRVKVIHLLGKLIVPRLKV